MVCGHHLQNLSFVGSVMLIAYYFHLLSIPLQQKHVKLIVGQCWVLLGQFHCTEVWLAWSNIELFGYSFFLLNSVPFLFDFLSSYCYLLPAVSNHRKVIQKNIILNTNTAKWLYSILRQIKMCTNKCEYSDENNKMKWTGKYQKIIET